MSLTSQPLRRDGETLVVELPITPLPDLPPTAAAPLLQLLSSLPPPLLALVACHLNIDTLLFLQRCSSPLRRLRSDASYMTAAWRNIQPTLDTAVSLSDWTLDRRERVWDEQHKQQLIPARMWQAALPVLRAVVDRRAVQYAAHVLPDNMRQLQQWVEAAQPTTWVFARRDDNSRLQVSYDVDVLVLDNVERVEVLRDITCGEMDGVAPIGRDVEVRCRLVLQACPYLQHLTLTICPRHHVEPSHEDTFALVPRLRSLSLKYALHQSQYWIFPDRRCVDFRRLLDSLPRLTALRSHDVYIDIRDLLDIASHSTLEQLEACAEHRQLGNGEWLRGALYKAWGWDDVDNWLPVAVEGISVDGGAEEPYCKPDVGKLTTVSGSDEASSTWMQQELWRCQAALNRTQPTRRSCEVRWALSDQLYKMWGDLSVDDEEDSAPVLRHFRRRLTVLRSTLRRQWRAAVAPEEPVAAEGRRSGTAAVAFD